MMSVTDLVIDPFNANRIVLGADRGSLVIVQDAQTRSELFRFEAFPGFAGGVNAAAGDVSGDSVPDIIVAAGPGSGGHVKVFNGNDGALLSSFLAFPGFVGGVTVAAGDFTGDGRDDIITGAAVNGHVKAFDGANGALVRSFLAFPGFTGGVTVAAGDVNGDSFDDIIVGAEANGHVKVFDGATNGLLQSFLAYPGFSGGVNVAAGDVNGDGFADIITGSATTFSHVKVFNGQNLGIEASFMAFSGAQVGVRVGAADVNGDGFDDILATPSAAVPHVKIFDGLSLAEIDSYFALDPNARTGLFVADSNSEARVAPPRMVTASIAPALERQLSTLQLAVDPSNPHGELKLTVDWGDGSTPEVVVCPPDPSTFSLTHRYAHDGQFRITLILADENGSIPGETVLSHTVVNVDLTVVAAGPGAGPHVKVFDSNTGELRFNFSPYQGRFRGVVHVATGDVNGDGFPDIITAPGTGASGGHVKVLDGTTGSLTSSFFAYAPAFRGGVFVAAGDVNGDGLADIITGAGPGAGPHVKAFSGSNGALLNSFFAYAPSFRGGVRVAAGDVNGDGFDDIITGAGRGAQGHVKAFSGNSGALLTSFFAYPGFSGGVFVAAGDINGDGKADIITGADRGAPPHVKIFDGGNNQLLASFFAYSPSFKGGVRVAAGDVNGDGRDDIITAGGQGSVPVKKFDGATLEAIDAFFALEGKNPGGLFVAASR